MARKTKRACQDFLANLGVKRPIKLVISSFSGKGAASFARSKKCKTLHSFKKGDDSRENE